MEIIKENRLNIKEQIELLPVDLFTKQRIMELTIKANSYDMLGCYAEYNLPQAFDWVHTTEGGDYWLKVYIEIEKFKYETKQKSDQKN